MPSAPKYLQDYYKYKHKYWIIVNDERCEKPWIVIHKVGWEIRYQAATLEEAKLFVEGQEK